MFLQGHSPTLQKQTRRRLKRQLKAVPTPVNHFTSLHALDENPVIYGSVYYSLHRSTKRDWPSCRLSTMRSRNPKQSCRRILPPCVPPMNPSCLIWWRLESAGGALSQRMVSENNMPITQNHATMWFSCLSVKLHQGINTSYEVWNFYYYVHTLTLLYIVFISQL